MTTVQPKIRLVDKDLKPQLDVILEQENEDGTIEPIDISSYTSIVLRVRKDSGIRFERDAVIDDAQNGEFHFVWQAGDLSAGVHEAEITFTDAVGPETVPDSAPIELIIRERV